MKRDSSPGQSAAASKAAPAGVNRAGQPRPRLLVVSQHYWPENFRINDIVQGFVENGVEVEVLCGLPNYPSGEWFEGYRYTGPRRERHGDVQIFRAGEIRRKGNTNLRIFLNFVSFPFFSLFSLPRLAGRKYDAVFCFETSPVYMMLPAIAAARIKGIPLTTYVLDLWPENLYPAFPVESPFLRRVLRWSSDWCYRRSPRLIALSAMQAERLKKVAKKPEKAPKIVVIPQYSEDFYAQDIRDEALAEKYAGYFNILFAGNISPLQDLENLVEAMVRVRKRPEGENIRCLIVGDGMSREKLQQLINEKGIADAFMFCGPCPPQDVPRWTGIADALFAGLVGDENVGLTVPAKIASYFAAGRPMLVAANDETARAAKASGAALSSPAGDAKALAHNILALAQMESTQRAEMGRRGRAYYEKNYRRSQRLAQLETFILRGETPGES